MQYRHYRPVINFTLRCGTSKEDVRIGWAEYIYQCHEGVLEELEEIEFIDEGPCPEEEGFCEECSG